MKKTSTEIIKELDAPIPRSAVSTREAGGGTKLSYLTSFYVIDRLNKTLGQGNWSYEIKDLRLVREGVIKRYSGEVFSCNYICNLMLHGTVGEIGGVWRNFSFNDVGYGDGTDKADPGKAHELAVKEAVTDAIKRCAKNLGMSLGLALYDKTQENVVDDDAKDADENRQRLKATSKPEPETKVHEPGQVSPSTPKQNAIEISTNAISANVSTMRAAIKAGVQVLIAKQKITAKDFREKYALTVKVDDLSDSDVVPLYFKVKNDFQELELS